jgi:hypothetical protein
MVDFGIINMSQQTWDFDVAKYPSVKPLNGFTWQQ